MSEKRRDNKKRLLWEGEVQEQNGRYKYRYTDSNGKRKSVYSWRLTIHFLQVKNQIYHCEKKNRLFRRKY